MVLLRIAENGAVDEAVRHQASIFFKNAVVGNWAVRAKGTGPQGAAREGIASFLLAF